MWDNGAMFAVQGIGMLDLLFDRAICSEVINAFLYIITSNEYRARHHITEEMGYVSVYAMVSTFIHNY